MNEELKTLANDFLSNLGYPVFSPNKSVAVRVLTCFAQSLIDSGQVVEASNYRDVCERLKQTLIPFGEWVMIDSDELNQGQIVDYDVLNNEYTVDKNGSWQNYKASSISKSNVSIPVKEISDEEIENEGKQIAETIGGSNSAAFFLSGFNEGAQWYRDQLKQ